MLRAVTRESEQDDVSGLGAEPKMRGSSAGSSPGSPKNGASRGTGTVSVLGGGMVVTGDVKGDGELRIEGRVEGSVTTEGRVIVEPDGHIQGDVEAREVIASGKVSGNITASGAVRMKCGCRIDADVTATSIELEEGGVVNGKLQMGTGA